MTTVTLTHEDLAAIVRGVPARDPIWQGTPVGKEVIAYLESKRWPSKTKCSYLSVLAPLSVYFADKQLSEISGREGRRMLVEFMNKTFKDVTDSTFATYTYQLRSFFDWAYEEELVDRDPARKLEAPSKGERVYDLFSPKEKRALETTQPRLRDRVAVMLIFDCLLRADDIRTLQFSQIVSESWLELPKGKKKTARTLPIRSLETRRLLAEHMLERQPEPTDYLLHPFQPLRYGTYPNYRTELRPLPHKPYSYTSLNRWWRDCLKNAGIKWSPHHHRLHDARHTEATDFMDENPGDKEGLQRLLRHRDGKATELYVHLSEERRLKRYFE